MLSRGLSTIFLVITGFCCSAWASTITYSGPSNNGPLILDTSWTPQTVPGSGDVVVFPTSATGLTALSDLTWGSIQVNANVALSFYLQGKVSFVGTDEPVFLSGSNLTIQAAGGTVISNAQQPVGNVGWPISYVYSSLESTSVVLDLRSYISTPTRVGKGLNLLYRSEWSKDADKTEKTWTIGAVDFRGSISGRTIVVSTFNDTALTATDRTCACTSYTTDCCVMNVTLSDNVISDPSADMSLSGDKVYLNVFTSSSASSSVGRFFILANYGNIKGTWEVNNRLFLVGTPLPVNNFVATFDAEGTFTSTSNGFVSCQSTICNFKPSFQTTGCHIEASQGTSVIQTTQISNSWLRVIDKVVAAVDFTIGKLIQANGTVVSGNIFAKNLTNDGLASNYLRVAAGARVILPTGAEASGNVEYENTQAIVGVKTTGVNILQSFNIIGGGFVQVVDVALAGDSYPDYVRLASGPGSVLSYTSTTLDRTVGIYGGQLQFATGTSLTGLTVALGMNSTLLGTNLRVTTLEFVSAGPNGSLALILDASTNLKVVGKLRVLLPAGSVGYISGPGSLDVTEGTIEAVSGKLIVTCEFNGSVTTAGGLIEFQPQPNVNQIFTNINLDGGYFSVPQSTFTFDTVTWISGGFQGIGSNTVTVNNLLFQTGENKFLSNVNVVVNTIIVGGNGEKLEFNGEGSTFTFVGDMTIPKNVVVDSGNVDFFNKGIITVSGTLGASTGRFVQTSSSAKRGLYQDTPSTYVTVNPGGSLTIQNLQNDGVLELQGIMTGTINNNGAVYIGNITAGSKSNARKFQLIGDYNQNANSGELIFSIAGPNVEDTDFMLINGTGYFFGKLTLNFGFSTSGIDPLTSWAVLAYSTYNTPFGTVNTPGFTGTGKLVYLPNGAQWEFIGCHNEKTSCTNCTKQSGSSFPGGCVWCRDVNACRAPDNCPSGNSVAISSGQANQCPDYQADPLLYLLFIPAGLIIIGGVVLLVIFLRRRARGGVNDATLLKRKPGPPEFLPIAFGKSMTESKLPRKDRDTYVPGLQKLKELITEKDMRILTALINDDVTTATDIDRVSQAITYVFESQGRFLPLMYKLIDEELGEHNTNEGTLFRGNTVTTTTWKFYSKLVGLEYLWNTLSDDIYLLVEKTSSGEISTEMDPVLLGEEEDVKVNKYQLLLTAQQILSKIIKSVEHIPTPLCMICHYLQEKVNEKYPSAKHTAIGGFIFLRFLNPAINLPEAYGLTRKVPSKEARRVFVLITKTLQSLANNIKLGGKEQHMAKLNDFIDENQNEINQFFDDCATLPGGTTESSVQPVDIPENILLLSLVELHRHIYYNLPRIKEHLDSDAYERLQAVVNGIGSPIKVENNN